MNIKGLTNFFRPHVKQPDGLISVLLDKKAEIGDRDDAAMDLHAFDEPEAEQALLQTVQNMEEEETVADSAGESLAEIWKRKSKWDPSVVSRMNVAARKFFENR